MLVLLAVVVAVAADILHSRVFREFMAHAEFDLTGAILVQRLGPVDLCQVLRADVDFCHGRKKGAGLYMNVRLKQSNVLPELLLATKRLLRSGIFKVRVFSRLFSDDLI